MSTSAPTQNSANSSAPSHLTHLNSDSADSCAAPTKRDENWRYVNVKLLSQLEPSSPSSDASLQQTLPQLPSELDGPAIIILNGAVMNTAALPAGVTIAATDQNTANDMVSTELQAKWQHHLPLDQQLSWALVNTPTLQLTCRGLVDQPVRLIAIHSQGQAAWQCQVLAQAGSAVDLEIVHWHLDEATREDAAIGIHAESGAGVRVSELSHGPQASQIMVSKCLVADKDASISWTSAVSGADLERHIALGHCNGAGSSVAVAAATLLDGDHQGHHLVRMHHHAGNATSRQQFNTIANGHSIGSFDGVISVDKGADGTDANQHSGNLQLSPKARIATRPQLDIYADDVIASHGATVGQPDPDEIAYLVSRGLHPDLATALITEGHLREALADMASQPLRDLSEHFLLSKLRREQ